MVNANRELATMPEVSVMIFPKSINRSAMRNRLSTLGHYEWVLQVNSNVTIPSDDFIRKYLGAVSAYAIDAASADGNGSDVDVICGNCTATDDATNLRCRYERAAKGARNLRNTNFMYRREKLKGVRYDETIHGYGYEDVIYMKAIQQAGLRIKHIDNPVSYGNDISNEAYLRNTEEALHTLYSHKEKLTDTRLIRFIERHRIVSHITRCLFPIVQRALRSNLTGSHPNLNAFAVYKVGYYLNIR